MLKYFTILLALAILLHGYIRPIKTDRMYFMENFQYSSIQETQKVPFQFNDTIPDDTLHVCYSEKNLPVAVYRDIQSGVCLDGECRLVKIRLYWTLTGRYLGYFLKDGQELTKREHLAFSEKEYEMLHKILKDSLSVLRYYTLTEIQPQKTAKIKTDGISGATAPDLSGYIVPEAAYTSYTLWHLVYGDTRDSIISWSSKNVSVSLIDSLMKCTDVYDKIWALKTIGKVEDNCQSFKSKVLDNLSIENFQLIQKSITVLENCFVTDSLIQPRLVPLLHSFNAELRNFVVNYFQSHHIHPKVAVQMVQELRNGNYSTINTILSALKYYKLSDNEIQTVIILLENKNREIAWRAYSYLLDLQHKSSALNKRLEKFSKNYK